MVTGVQTCALPIYPVICDELCGEGHALMRTEAVVMTRKAFLGWVKAEERAARLVHEAHEEAEAVQSYRSETSTSSGTSLGDLLKEHIGSGEGE